MKPQAQPNNATTQNEQREHLGTGSGVAVAEAPVATAEEFNEISVQEILCMLNDVGRC